MTTKKKRILHITESYGGGVTSAINSYATHSSQYEHYLFAAKREGDSTGEENNNIFSEILLAERKLASINSLKKFYTELDPEIVHIHSTIAGFICRILPLFPTNKIIYTPHGYAFLRNDHYLLKKAYLLIEKTLARRTSVLAGCSKHEASISAKLSSTRTHEIVNICDPIQVNISASKKTKKKPIIGMTGRITEQKGYDYFREIALGADREASFKWIGGGEDKVVNQLKEVNIEVTGWLPRAQVIRELQSLDLYIHTAAWDGFPISVLEAAALDIPILLRGIGPFHAENLSTVESINEAIHEIKNFVALNSDTITRAKENTFNIKSYHSQKNIRQSLAELYDMFSHPPKKQTK